MSTECLWIIAIPPLLEVTSYSNYLCRYLIVLLGLSPLLLATFTVFFIITHLTIFLLLFFLTLFIFFPFPIRVTAFVTLIFLFSLLSFLLLGQSDCYLLGVLITQVVKSIQAEVITGVLRCDAQTLKQWSESVEVLDCVVIKGEQVLTH